MNRKAAGRGSVWKERAPGSVSGRVLAHQQGLQNKQPEGLEEEVNSSVLPPFLEDPQKSGQGHGPGL